MLSNQHYQHRANQKLRSWANAVFQNRGVCGQAGSFIPLPLPRPFFFFCSGPNFLDEHARKRLLRRLLTDHLRLLAFAAKLCTSSGVKLLRWLPDWLPTTTGFCCETLHQFWCETFTVIAWRTTYDYWLLLRNFAPVLVWNFYGDCLTDYLRLLAFAAKLCTSSGVKLLRWLPDWLLTTTGFWCETLIVWRHTIMASWLQKKWVSKIKLRMTSSY